MVPNSRGLAAVALCISLVVPALARAEVLYLDGAGPRIVNGLRSQGFPTTGALLFGGNPATATTYCSGTMIGCETFLTAAHCVADNLNPASYTVFLQHGGVYSVSGIEVHQSYSFPVADLALIKLSSPVSGISPTPIDTVGGHANGTGGMIAGFGRTGGGSFDYGVKRFGAIEVDSCIFGVSNTTSICWNFTNPVAAAGADSNTCNADSGGPLFIDNGTDLVLAGVTSGGNSSDCMAFDNSFDTRISFYASYLQAAGGADLANTSCGGIPQVGDADVEVVALEGALDGSTPQQTHSFDVDPGSMVLRVTLNAIDDGISDFNLYVRAGVPPTTTNYDCAVDGSGQYGGCEFNNPSGGMWHVLVDRSSGAGAYQVTATSFGTFCSDPANDGLACDDDNACTSSDVCASGACVGSAVADGTGCDDGNACTLPDACVAAVCVGQSTCGDGAIQTSCEECDDGGVSSGDGCDSSCAVERCYECSGTPSACGIPGGCVDPGRAIVVLKNSPIPDKGRLTWKWLKGAAATPSFGDPVADYGYDLCIWEGGELVASAGAPDGGICGSRPCWRATGAQWAPSGYKYKNKASNGEGVRLVKLKEGVGTAKILWKARGANLSLPVPDSATEYFATSPVIVQTVRQDGGACWQSTFSNADVQKNDGQTFKATK